MDPGVNYMYTAHDNNGKTFQLRPGRYFHMAQFNKQRFWMTNLRKKNPNYDQLISHLPTMDVISSANIMNSSFQILRHRDFLFRFCMEFGFRKWRFKTKRFSQKSLPGSHIK